MDPRLWPYVETIWNYHRLGQSVGPAGAILVLCSHDTIVAERGAQLWLDGLAPRLVFSGGLGAITRHLWTEPEAERFARIAEEMGVPRERMLLETESTNTGENVLFTRRLLERKGIDVERLLVVQKPYMERRSWATFKKVWPEKEITVTSPQLSLDEYLARGSNEALPPD
ncbi:MAG: YdcF family protein, partial [Thermoanaerobaculia bacterium]